jgi:hypothetical protein
VAGEPGQYIERSERIGSDNSIALLPLHCRATHVRAPH